VKLPYSRRGVAIVGHFRDTFGSSPTRFIKDFSKIAKPMTRLLEMNKDFEWMKYCQDRFEELEKHLTSAPVLTLPDIIKKFDIYCDTSRQRLGCVLMQEGEVDSYAS
jgi:hypothetical protein